jgi:hypothetical protein
MRPTRVLKLETRISEAEIVHSDPDLVLVYAQLRTRTHWLAGTRCLSTVLVLSRPGAARA